MHEYPAVPSWTALVAGFHPRPARGLLVRALLAVLVAFAAVPSAAAQYDEPIQFTGTVTVVTVFDESIEAELDELGIVVGAPVTLELLIDPRVPGEPGGGPEYTFYPDAVADFRVVIGDYEAFYDFPVTPMGNSVQVGDNDTSGSFTFDSYVFAALGAETPDLLRGDGPFDVVGFNGSLADSNGKTVSNGDIVQNLKAFKFGSGAVGGSKGVVGFALDLGKGPKKPSPLALAQSAQLKACGVLLRSITLATAKAVARHPDADPRQEKLEADLIKALTKFVARFGKIEKQALAKGLELPVGTDDLQEFGTGLLQSQADLMEELVEALDDEDPVDRTLHAKLLRALARHVAADLTSHAAHLLKLPVDKLLARLAKSRAVHLAAAAKAVAAAEKKEVDYAGPDAEEVADAVTELVDATVDQIKG